MPSKALSQPTYFNTNYPKNYPRANYYLLIIKITSIQSKNDQNDLHV